MMTIFGDFLGEKNGVSLKTKACNYLNSAWVFSQKRYFLTKRFLKFKICSGIQSSDRQPSKKLQHNTLPRVFRQQNYCFTSLEIAITNHNVSIVGSCKCSGHMIGLSFLFYFPDFDATHCGG
jgi:hypothetical protein